MEALNLAGLRVSNTFVAELFLATFLLLGCAPVAHPSPGATTVAPATVAAHPSAVAQPTTADPPAPTAEAAAQVTTVARTVPNFSHIFVIVMENREYDQIIGSPDAPYINQLANSYALATRYYAIRHPSLPNYLALISGSIQGTTDDCETCSVTGLNLVDQLETHHKTWTAYMEGLPGPCYNGAAADGGLYARRHDPFMYFVNIRENPRRCQQVVPLSQFSSDLSRNQLSDFVWITPNLDHDMHDASSQTGDSWLAGFVPTILKSSAWRDGGVLFITWDEGTTDAGCCGNAAGGHIPMLVIAANGTPGYRSDVSYSHYSLLRTIEDAWQLGYWGKAADSTTSSMADFFHQPVSNP